MHVRMVILEPFLTLLDSAAKLAVLKFGRQVSDRISADAFVPSGRLGCMAAGDGSPSGQMWAAEQGSSYLWG